MINVVGNNIFKILSQYCILIFSLTDILSILRQYWWLIFKMQYSHNLWKYWHPTFIVLYCSYVAAILRKNMYNIYNFNIAAMFHEYFRTILRRQYLHNIQVILYVQLCSEWDFNNIAITLINNKWKMIYFILNFHLYLKIGYI